LISNNENNGLVKQLKDKLFWVALEQKPTIFFLLN
jgi:hypothetical protein